MTAVSVSCRFTPAITRINEDLEQFAATRPNMNFVSCGQDFTYESETGRIHQALMPDGVNLNAAGMEQLASCLQPVIHVSDLLNIILMCVCVYIPISNYT